MASRGGRVAKLLADVVDTSAIDGDQKSTGSTLSSDVEPPSEPGGEGDGSDPAERLRRARRSKLTYAVAVALLCGVGAVVLWQLGSAETGSSTVSSANPSAGAAGEKVLVIRDARLVAQDEWGEPLTVAQLAGDGRVHIAGTFVGHLHADGRFVDRGGRVQWQIDKRGVITRPSGQFVPFMLKEDDSLVEPQANQRGHISEDGTFHSPWGKQVRSEGCVPDARRACLLLMVVNLTLPPETVHGVARIEFCGTKYTPLSRNVACRDKKWTDLSALSKLPHVKSLVLSRTAVVDLTPLAKHDELRALALDHTPVAELGPLANLSGLRVLTLNSTKVADLSHLGKLQSLESLALADTRVSDLSALASLTKLRQLDLSRTKVKDLKDLTSLTSLTRLSLEGAPVKELAPLEGLGRLRSLNVKNTKVSKAKLAAFVKKRPEVQLVQ